MKRALAKKEPPLVVRYKAERETLDAPNEAGLWFCDFVGQVFEVRAKRGTGELYFPADTYGEEETLVSAMQRTHAVKWSKATKVIDV